MGQGISRGKGTTAVVILSIIIPVYNVESYVAHCLDSVLACDLSDCEIVLSLRHSMDQSEAICADYVKRHSKIHLLWQDGEGLSNARNCAMRVAKGDYVLFVDSDDYVNGLVLSELIDRLRKGEITDDVIAVDYHWVEHLSGRTRAIYQIGEKTPDARGMQFLPQMLGRRQAFWNVWRYIYRRSFLIENQIGFMENTLSEDIDYTTRVFLAEPRILFTHSPYYYYNVDQGGSLMDRPTLRRLRETLNVISISIERLRKSFFSYGDLMIARFQFEYIMNLARVPELGAPEQTEALGLFGNQRDVLKDSVDPVVRALAGMINLLGVRTCSAMLYKLKMLRRWLRGNRKEG